LKFVEKPLGDFVDRRVKEKNIESIDVIMLTLDSENFLEKSLYSIYQEIPVRKLIVCDGGSKDNTIKILKKFPRIDIHIRTDIRTTGKVLEFLFSLTESEWFALIDSDIILTDGWYDEMKKHQKSMDVIENGHAVLAYHMYREFKVKLEENARSSDMCHLVKKKAVENYHCDDDYMWRFTDYLFRQSVEKSEFKYGKVNTTFHIHNETERIQYKSDNEKNFQKIIWKEPEYVIIDKNKEKQANIKHAKAVVKYLDPENPAVKDNKGMGNLIKILDRKWVEENGPKWLELYNKSNVNVESRKLLKGFLKKIK